MQVQKLLERRDWHHSPWAQQQVHVRLAPGVIDSESEKDKVRLLHITAHLCSKQHARHAMPCIQAACNIHAACTHVVAWCCSQSRCRVCRCYMPFHDMFHACPVTVTGPCYVMTGLSGTRLLILCPRSVSNPGNTITASQPVGSDWVIHQGCYQG